MPDEIRAEVAESPRLPRNWHAPSHNAVLNVLWQAEVRRKAGPGRFTEVLSCDFSNRAGDQW